MLTLVETPHGDLPTVDANSPPLSLTRRAFVLGMPLAAAGCVTSQTPSAFNPSYVAMYASISDGGYQIPGVDISQVDPRFLRQVVPYPGPHKPGTVVVNPDQRFLYHVEGGGKATRYGVGVGREGYSLHGLARVGRKAEWPHWTPTATMMERIPRYREYASGLDGGLGNPLGARAMYLYRGDRDTFFRIHGTNEPWTIGQAVSSGCIRMVNQDVMDLYNRVPVGTQVYII